MPPPANALLEEYNIEIGGGLGALKGKAWRIVNAHRTGRAGKNPNRRINVVSVQGP